MPTGYTAPIGDGISFNEYALSCARAFGACIMMRDEPSDAPIPDEFKPSDYSEKRLSEANKRLAELKKMSAAACDKEAKSEYARTKKMHVDGMAKEAALKQKYEAMLAEVQAWNPPTSEHEGLKVFMSEQIRETIKFDCSTSYHGEALGKLCLMSGEEWREKEIGAALRDISYHSKSQKEENERAAQRTKWVRQLRQSLPVNGSTSGKSRKI